MRFSPLGSFLPAVLCGVVSCCASAQAPAKGLLGAGQPSGPQAGGTQDGSTTGNDVVPVTIVHSADDPVSFTVHVDGRALVWTPATETEPRRTEVSLLVTTFDKRNKELNRDAKIITASAPTSVAPTGRLLRNIDYAYKLDIDPRAVRARFTVRVMSTGRFGTVDTALQPIVVPPLPPAKPAP